MVKTIETIINRKNCENKFKFANYCINSKNVSKSNQNKLHQLVYRIRILEIHFWHLNFLIWWTDEYENKR